jgi:hypothetical protein
VERGSTSRSESLGNHGCENAAGTFAAHGAQPEVEVADFDALLAGPGAWLIQV